jgi:hypothetical protein
MAVNHVQYCVSFCRKLCHLDINNESGADGKPDTSEPVTYCLQALLAIEVLLNPSSDTQMFVNELLLVQRLKVNITGSLPELVFASVSFCGSICVSFLTDFLCCHMCLHYASFS